MYVCMYVCERVCESREEIARRRKLEKQETRIRPMRRCFGWGNL